MKIERPEGTREEKTQRAEGIEHRVKTARGQVARAGRKRTKRKIHCKMQIAKCKDRKAQSETKNAKCKLLGDSVDVSLLVGKIGIMAKEVPKR